MFCHKCGSKSIEGSAFCQKCGTKLVTDDTSPQTSASAPMVEPTVAIVAESSETSQDHQQSSSNNIAVSKVPAGLLLFLRILTIAGGISIVLILVSSIFRLQLPINPVIIVVGAGLGIIGRNLSSFLQWKKLSVIELSVGLCLLVMTIIFAFSGGGIGGGSDKYVQMVKGGTLDGYPQKTVGRAFDDFLSNPKWESGLSEDGERFVNVKGGVLYSDKEVELVVQFIINEADGIFAYNACEMNGIPQNDFFYWGLLERIYSDSPVSQEVSQNASTPALIGDRIVVGETQIFDGRMEVTLDYVEFVTQSQTEGTGVLFPEEGNIFLQATLTVKNIGTEQAKVGTILSSVVYDGAYEFSMNLFGSSAKLSGINPLTPPVTGSITFEVASVVADSDKSLVVNIDDGYIGGEIMTFVIRPGDGDFASQGASSGSALPPSNHDDAYNIAQAWLAAHPDMGATISGGDNDLYHADGGEYYLFYLGEMYYANLLVNSRTGALSIMINHDGENPYSEIEPLDDYYNRYWGDSQSISNDSLSKMLYAGVPVYQYFHLTNEELKNAAGPPSYEGEAQAGYVLDYEGIRFILNNLYDDENHVSAIEIWKASLLTVDGDGLDIDREGLISVLGNPYNEGWDYELEVYYMEYYIWDTPMPVVITIEMTDAVAKAQAITIRIYWEGM